jgi:transcription antitermination factor NusB
MKTKTDPRHLKRIRLLKALYSQQYSKTRAPLLSADDRKIFRQLISNILEINSIIDKCSHRFGASKMAKIDLSLLQLAVFEMQFLRQAPKKVIVDEYVELAKEFGGDKSPQLVNGILGKII